MQLHVLLPDESYRRLLAVAVPRHRIVRLSSAKELLRAAMSNEVTACVLDPLGRRPDAIATLIAALGSGDFPVLLYTSLKGGAMHVILDLQRACGADILLRGHDEQPELLRAIVDQMGATTPASLVLRDLAPCFRRLPSVLGIQCVGLFGGQSIPATVPQFFSRAYLEQRTGNRWMRRVGLRDAEHLLGCARLMLTWNGVRDPAVNLELVAERAGIGTGRALTEAYHTYCGLPPRRAARELVTAAFAGLAASATRS